jgi:hypothetical protein
MKLTDTTTGWRCDLCRVSSGSQSSKNRYQCASCDTDLCVGCYAASGGKATPLCHKGHFMPLTMCEKGLSPGGYRGGWICSDCPNRSASKTSDCTVRFCCLACEDDLCCSPCAAKRIEKNQVSQAIQAKQAQQVQQVQQAQQAQQVQQVQQVRAAAEQSGVVYSRRNCHLPTPLSIPISIPIHAYSPLIHPSPIPLY